MTRTVDADAAKPSRACSIATAAALLCVTLTLAACAGPGPTPNAGTGAPSPDSATAASSTAASAAGPTEPPSTAPTGSTTPTLSSTTAGGASAAGAAASRPPTYPATAKVVALTFDDGPNPRYTPQILRILETQHVRATFFMVGQMVNAHGAAAKAVAADGMLIGNHSEGHKDMTRMKDAQVTYELEDAQTNIERVTGVTPRYFRFPFGSITPRVRRVAERLGLKVVGWGLDSGDWERPSTASIVSRVARNAKPGTIVLMHDGGGDRSRTVAALAPVIRALRAKGYTFVTVDQLAPQLLIK